MRNQMATAEQKLALSELYIAFFNRAPEFEGFNYWVERLDGGTMSLQSMAADWWNTQAETKSTYPTSLSTEAFVEKIYTNVLGRDTDPEGKTFWVDKINKGLILRENFIMSVIEGAKAPTGGVSDRQYLANKAEVGVYFAEQHAPSSEASSVLDSVTDDTASVQSSKELIDNWTYFPNINYNITIDASIPEADKIDLLNTVKQILTMYNLTTGLDIRPEFTIVSYPEENGIGWSSWTRLNLGSQLPTQNQYAYHFLSFELAHLFYAATISSQVNTYTDYPDEINLRDEEMIGQGLAVAAYDKYGYLLDVNDKVKTQFELPLNSNFKQALELFKNNVNLYSIYQFDVNPDNQNAIIDVVRTEMAGLYAMDPNFYQHFFNDGLNYSSYEEYKELFISSVTTRPRSEVEAYVNNMTYFRQIDEKNDRPQYTLDIALFSSDDFQNTYSSQTYALNYPDSFRVFGQSYNIDDYTKDMAAWQREPDPDFFSHHATVWLLDQNGHRIWSSENITLSTDFQGTAEKLPSTLSHGNYTLHAEVSINGVLLSDDLSFIYNG